MGQKSEEKYKEVIAQIKALMVRKKELSDAICALRHATEEKIREEFYEQFRRGEVKWDDLCLPMESGGTEHPNLQSHRPLDHLFCIACGGKIGREAHMSGGQRIDFVYIQADDNDKNEIGLRLSLSPYVCVHRRCVPIGIIEQRWD